MFIWTQKTNCHPLQGATHYRVTLFVCHHDIGKVAHVFTAHVVHNHKVPTGKYEGRSWANDIVPMCRECRAVLDVRRRKALQPLAVLLS